MPPSSPTGARPRAVRGDGLDLAVWEHGDADRPTIVLVHGYPDTHGVWDGVVPHLSTDFHVVTYDVRGAGESGVPGGIEGYDLDHLMADLAAVVDAVSPDAPVHLVGHDWGSIQGWEAVTVPALDGRLASYTSISGPGLDHAATWVRRRRSLRWSSLHPLLRQGLRSWYTAFFRIPHVAELGWRTFVPRGFERYRREVEGVPAEHPVADTLASHGANGVLLYRRNLPRRMSDPHPRVTDVPVLLIVPTGDRYVTPALLDDTGDHATDLRRVDVEGGHWIPLTQPERIAGLVREHVLMVGAR